MFTDAFIKLFGYPCYILTQCGIYFSTAFLQSALNKLLSIYRSFTVKNLLKKQISLISELGYCFVGTVKNLLKKQISLISELGYCFVGTVMHTMMTAMIKPPDSHSDSEDSDSPQPPPSTSNTRSPHSKSKSSNYQLHIKSKFVSLKNKNIMNRSSTTKPLAIPNISPPYPNINTPPVLESCSPPPPISNLHTNPHNYLSLRHSQLPPLSSPPSFHNSALSDDTNCDNSSNDSPIHNAWQSKKIHPPPYSTTY